MTLHKSVGEAIQRVTQPTPPPATKQPGPVGAFFRRPSVGMLVILIALMAVFSAFAPTAFLGVYNLRSMALSGAVIGVAALGQTFVLATGGIDLSIGAVLIFSSVISSKVFGAMGGAQGGWGAVGAGFLAGLAAAMLWGLVNGLIVTKMKVPPLIATLGTLGMALGAAQLIANGLDLRTVPGVMTDVIGYGALAGIPILVIIAIVTALIAGFVMWKTTFGVHTKAVGSNPQGALRSGIKVDNHLIIIYVLCGAFVGLSAFMSLAQFQTTSIGGHTNDNLATIAGAVLGGTSLFGGVATIFGTVIGILVPVVLQSGFVIIGVQPFWQTFAVGAVLVVAVFVDQVRRRNQQRV